MVKKEIKRDKDREDKNIYITETAGNMISTLSEVQYLGEKKVKSRKGYTE